MRHRLSKFRSPAGVVLLVVALWPSRASAQACCAGSGALTPGRLALYEVALVGTSTSAADAFGSIDAKGRYATPPPGTTEFNFEQDIFGSLRFLKQGQTALLVPFVATRRQTPTSGSEFGGGIGDVNLSARWDFGVAGQSRVVPGIGLLGGMTLPTGTSPESAGTPLATGATGVGALQGNVGFALEQSFGRWLVNANTIVAARAPRTTQGVRTSLGAQVTSLAALAYAFNDDAAAALLVSYTFEGDATVDGKDAQRSGRRLLRMSGSGAYPLSDRLRVQGALFFDPPIAHVDQNQSTSIGLTLTVIFSWS